MNLYTLQLLIYIRNIKNNFILLCLNIQEDSKVSGTLKSLKMRFLETLKKYFSIKSVYLYINI